MKTNLLKNLIIFFIFKLKNEIKFKIKLTKKNKGVKNNIFTFLDF